MIKTEVLSRLPQLRKEFQAARPFKHVCVDDFFEIEAAEKLLEDFPAFDAKNAINEFGEVGRKATVPTLGHISPFYAEVHRYITSPEFLSAMSEMTGIPDLLPDPRMFGGGTHENRHGQGLNPHVDFNFEPEHGLHRRLNLILYLNKGWREEWGGAIELHSDPWNEEENQVSAFNCTFNRAVVFETNEYSWHGFPLIDLPEELRSTSRKSLSIYLYTAERPQEEIAASHGTFYVPRPLSVELVPGGTVTSEMIRAVRDAVSERNLWIRHYQGLEVRLSEQIEAGRRALREFQENFRAPVTGAAAAHGKSQGLLADGWIEPYASFEAKPRRPFDQVVVRGWVAPGMGTPLDISVSVDGVRAGSGVTQGDSFEIVVPCTSDGLTPGAPLKFEIRTERLGKPKDPNGDERDLAFVLSEVDFVPAQKAKGGGGGAARAILRRLFLRR